MTIKTASFLLLLLPTLSLFSKQWVDEATLKSLLQSIRSSSYKYDFKSVDSLTTHLLPDHDSSSTITSTLEAAALEALQKMILSKRHSEAAAALERAISRSPYNAAYLCLQAQNEQARKNMPAAQEALRKALVLNRWRPETLQLLKTLHPDQVPTPAFAEQAVARKTTSKNIIVFYQKEVQEKKTHYSWLSYALSRALWRYEGGWQVRFPNERWYQPSFEEALFCYKTLVFSWQKTLAREQNLTDPDLDRLLALDKRGLLGGYVFYHVYNAPLHSGNHYLLKAHEAAIKGYYPIFIGAAQ